MGRNFFDDATAVILERTGEYVQAVEHFAPGLQVEPFPTVRAGKCLEPDRAKTGQRRGGRRAAKAELLG